MINNAQFSTKLIRFFAIVLISFILTGLLSIGIIEIFKSQGISTQNIWLQYITLILQTLCIFGGSVFINRFFDKETDIQILPVSNIRNLQLLLLGIVAWILSIIPVNGLVELNNSFSFPEKWATLEAILRSIQQQNEDYLTYILTQKGALHFVVASVVIAALPAIFEELFFRCYLQQLFYRYTQKKWLSIITIAIVFSVLHFDFFAFLPRVLLGVLFGVVFHATHSLWLPIIIHFINNMSAVVMNKLVEKNRIDELGSFGLKGYEQILFFISFIAAIYVYHLIINKYSNKKDYPTS